MRATLDLISFKKFYAYSTKDESKRHIQAKIVPIATVLILFFIVP